MVNVDQQHILQRRTKKKQALYLQPWRSGTVVELLLTWKIISCTYSECVSLALSNQQRKRMCRIILLCVMFNDLLNFSTLSHERPNFQWRLFYPKMRFLIFDKILWKSLFLKEEIVATFPTYMFVCMEMHIFRVRIYQNMNSLCSFLMSSNNRFFKSVRWGTRCMDG